MALDRRRKPYYYLSSADVDEDFGEVDDDTLNNSSREDVARFLINILCETGGKSALTAILDRKLKPLKFWEIDTPEALRKFCQSFPQCFDVRSAPSGEDAEEVEVTTKINLCGANIKKMGSCADDGECGCLHLCRFFMLSGKCDCKGPRVYEHELHSDHNVSVLKHFLMDHLVLEELQTLVRRRNARITQTLPIVCRFYNNPLGCSKGDRCMMLHLCKHYVFSQCKYGAECLSSHDPSQDKAKAVLEMFAIAPDDLRSFMGRMNPPKQLHPPKVPPRLPISQQGLLPVSKQGLLPVSQQGLLPVSKQGLLPVSQQGLLPISQQGLLPVSQQGLLPISQQGLLPVSKQGLLPISQQGLLPISQQGLLPVSKQGLLPVSKQGLLPIPQHFLHPLPWGGPAVVPHVYSQTASRAEAGDLAKSVPGEMKQVKGGNLCPPAQTGGSHTGSSQTGASDSTSPTADNAESSVKSVAPAVFSTLFSRRRGHVMKRDTQQPGKEGDLKEGDKKEDPSAGSLPTPMNPFTLMTVQQDKREPSGSKEVVGSLDSPSREEFPKRKAEVLFGQNQSFIPLKEADASSTTRLAPGRPIASVSPQMKIKPELSVSRNVDVSKPQEEAESGVGRGKGQPGSQAGQPHTAQLPSKVPEVSSPTPAPSLSENLQIVISSLINNVKKLHAKNPGPEQHLINYLSELAQPDKLDEEMKAAEEQSEREKLMAAEKSERRSNYRSDGELSDSDNEDKVSKVNVTQEKVLFDYNHRPTVELISDMLNSRENSPCRETPHQQTSSPSVSGRPSRIRRNSLRRKGAGKGLQYDLVENPEADGDLEEVSSANSAVSDIMSSEEEQQHNKALVTSKESKTKDRSRKDSEDKAQMEVTTQPLQTSSNEGELTTKANSTKNGQQMEKDVSSDNGRKTESETDPTKCADTDMTGKLASTPNEVKKAPETSGKESAVKSATKPGSSRQASESQRKSSSSEQKQPAADTKSSNPEKPPRKLSGSDKGSSRQRAPAHRNSSGSRRSPGKGSSTNSKPSPSNRRPSPSNRRPSPSNRRPSPSNRRSSPSKRTLSPSARRPLADHRSSGRTSPGTKRSLDARSPERKRLPDRRSPDRSSDRRRSPDRRAADTRALDRSPGRRRSPDRRSPWRRRSLPKRSDEARSVEGSRISGKENEGSEHSRRASPYSSRLHDRRHPPDRRSPNPKRFCHEENRQAADPRNSFRKSSENPGRYVSRGLPPSHHGHSQGSRKTSRSPERRPSPLRRGLYEAAPRLSPPCDQYRQDADRFHSDGHSPSHYPLRRTPESWERGWNDRERRADDIKFHRRRSTEREKGMGGQRLRDRERVEMERGMDERRFRRSCERRRSRSVERNRRDGHFERSSGDVNEDRLMSGPSRNRREGADMPHDFSPHRRGSPGNTHRSRNPERTRWPLGSREGSREGGVMPGQAEGCSYMAENEQWPADHWDFLQSQHSLDAERPREGDDLFHGERFMDADPGREHSFPRDFDGQPHEEEEFRNQEGRFRHRLGPSPDRFEDQPVEDAYPQDRYAERGPRGLRDGHPPVFEEGHFLARERGTEDSLPRHEEFEGREDWHRNSPGHYKGHSRGSPSKFHRFTGSKDWKRGNACEGDPRDDHFPEREVVLKDNQEHSMGDWRQLDTPPMPGPSCGRSCSPCPFPSDFRPRGRQSGQARSPAPFHAHSSRHSTRYSKHQREEEFVPEGQSPSLREKIQDFVDEARHSSSRGPSPSGEDLHQFGPPPAEAGDMYGRPELAGSSLDLCAEEEEFRSFRQQQRRGDHLSPGSPSKRPRGVREVEQKEQTFGKRKRLSDSRARSQEWDQSGQHRQDIEGRKRRGIKVQMIFNSNRGQAEAMPPYLDLDQPRPEDDYADTRMFDTPAEGDDYGDGYRREDPFVGNLCPDEDMGMGSRGRMEDVGDMIQAQRARVMSTDLRNKLQTHRKWHSLETEKEHIQIRVRRQEHQEHMARRQYVDDDGREVVMGDHD